MNYHDKVCDNLIPLAYMYQKEHPTLPKNVLVGFFIDV